MKVIEMTPSPQQLAMPARTPAPEPIPTKPRRLLGSLFGSRDKKASAAPTPTTKAAPAQAPTPPAVPTIPDKPYVTTGTVIFHDSPPAPPEGEAIAAPIASATGASLRQAILAACGNTVKDVEVRSKPDNGMQVTIKISRSDAIEDVMNKTSGLSEMASLQVQTLFVVEP